MLTDSLTALYDNWKYVNIPLQYLYLALVLLCFILSLGNRPAGCVTVCWVTEAELQIEGRLHRQHGWLCHLNGLHAICSGSALALVICHLI